MQSRTSFRREGRLYWQCAGCQHPCSVTCGTVLEATKLPLTHWFMAMRLLTQAKNNVSALDLPRQLVVSYRTTWLIRHKLLQAMVLAESGRRLTGRVEVDDAYLGGDRSGGKAGRGSENKVPFVVAVQTTEVGRAHLAYLSARPFAKEAVKDFIATTMGLPLTVVSDGLGCFTVARSMGAVHDREVTGGGKASVLNEKFRAVNTLIDNFKTALSDTEIDSPVERRVVAQNEVVSSKNQSSLPFPQAFRVRRPIGWPLTEPSTTAVPPKCHEWASWPGCDDKHGQSRIFALERREESNFINDDASFGWHVGR